MLISDGGGGGEPSAPAVDYHVMTMSQLQAALQTSPKSIQAVQQAWQSFASVLSAYTTGPGCPLDAAVKGLAGGWSGEASAHFMKRVGEVSEFAAQLGAAASVQASGVSAPNGADFDGATWTIGDCIDRMNQAHQDYTNAVRDCLKDFMNGLLGNNFSIGTMKPTPNGQVANANTAVQQQGYDFVYRATGLLDDIVLTGSAFPYVTHSSSGYGRGPTVSSHADGSAVVTATVAAPVAQPGESPTMTAQVTLNPGTDVEWAWKTFQVPVLWHQFAILLNYTTPIAYQMPVKMFPQPPKSPGQPQKQGSGGGGGGGAGGLGGFGSGNGAGFGGGGGGFAGGGAPGTGTGGLPGSGGGAPGTGTGGLPGSGGGAPGGGFGSVGGGPGSLGGGSGSTPTHLAGLGGAGLPGGLGGGGLPGGFGGGGGLPGGPGGLANAGGPGGLGPGGAAGAAANEAAIAAHGEVPLMPPMMPPMMNQNQDNTRQRKSWLPEDDDLWGGAVDTVPPVISSDG